MLPTSTRPFPSLLVLILLTCATSLHAQSFFFGADLSYVNEMEDCGVVYREDGNPKDPYDIFADHGTNLVRLRLWHTPEWYDDLNNGHRYSDFNDVKKSIQRAKAAGMQVLLDYHLSDNWADPGKQLVPAAWLDVVDDLPTLQDSLYNYISSTLLQLDQEDLLPDMVQIGNETNKGILLSPDDNASWTLDWPRNAALFNTALEAVADVESQTGQSIQTAIHIAGPSNVEWFIEQFHEHGVTDFDIIGISYYWAWHMPTTIAATGDIIQSLKSDYPDKEVMIFETGYIWTTDANDNANNIISEVHPDYSPASPENQRDWLIALTAEVMSSGGSGVIYWEPAWVSSDCWTQWGQGSHQEHATFFDFNNNLLENGGMAWMSHDYTTSTTETPGPENYRIFMSGDHQRIIVKMTGVDPDSTRVLTLTDMQGHRALTWVLDTTGGAGLRYEIGVKVLVSGVYVAVLRNKDGVLKSEKVLVL